jgi:hypothetical protein
MNGFHPPAEFFFGENNDAAPSLPGDVKRRLAVPNLVHVSGKALAKIRIAHMAWLGFQRLTNLAHRECSSFSIRYRSTGGRQAMRADS